MNLLVVVLLGGLWASILLPGAIRNRRQSCPISSVDSFERSMGILAPDRLSARSEQPSTSRHVFVVADPAGLAVGASRTKTVRRRRAVLGRLTGALIASAAAAIVLGGAFSSLFVACLAVAVGYVLILAQVRAHEEQTRRTVRRLPVRPSVEPGDVSSVDETPDGSTATVRVRRWGA